MMRLKQITGVVPPGRFRFYQQETRRAIGPFNTLARLLDEIKRHRTANRIPIGPMLSEEVQDWMCRHMDSADAYCTGAAAGTFMSKPKGGNGYDGSDKWRALHTYALAESPSETARAIWLSEFAASLPCGECKQGWRALTKSHPLPRGATQDEFFVWTVMMHNLVNEKLGREEFALDAARQKWSE